jgi:hypothetical protein
VASPAGTRLTEQDETDTGTTESAPERTEEQRTEEQRAEEQPQATVEQPVTKESQAPPKPDTEGSTEEAKPEADGSTSTEARAERTAEQEPATPEEEGEGEPEPSSTAPTTRIRAVKKAEPEAKAPRFSPSRLAMGGILVLAGIAWLLEVTNTVSINWGVLLSIALLAAGAGLVLMGLRGSMNRGLVIMGIVLAAILTAAATLRIDIAGGIGGKTIHPTSAKSFAKTYRMAAGQLTIDLRHVSFNGSTPKVKATVGLGQLVVLVPPGASVRIHERAGAGQISAFTHSQSGVDLDHTFFRGSGPPVVTLDLSVGLGQVTVHK